MSMIKVIHKVRAYIAGRTYGPGEEGLIDEVHFNESVHEKVAEPTPPVAYDDSGPVTGLFKKPAP